MKIEEQIVYKLPEWCLNYLVNGCIDSITEEEIEMFDHFRETEKLWDSLGVWAIGDASYFSWTNDIDNWGNTVYDCTFTRWLINEN